MKKLAILLLSAIILGGCNRLDVHQPLTSTNLTFSQTESIAQTFISSHPNLNIVSICLRNPAKEVVPFEFRLHEATISGDPLRSIAFSSSNIDNLDCTRFQFDPVGDSAGKTYVAEIITTNAGQGVTSSGVSIEASGTDLHFKTFYKQSLNEVWHSSVNQLITRLGQDPWFLGIYTTMISIVGIYLYKAKSHHEK